MLSSPVLLSSPRDKIVRDVEITQVTFNQLNDREIAQYIASGEPLDKAGAYAHSGLRGALDSAHRGLLLQRDGASDCANDRFAGGGRNSVCSCMTP